MSVYEEAGNRIQETLVGHKLFLRFLKILENEHQYHKQCNQALVEPVNPCQWQAI